MGQQYNPEPDAQLRERYPAAVRNIYDLRDPKNLQPENVPSKQPEHVFDTTDGLRLMVSREKMPTGQVGVHVSASLNAGTPLYRALPLMRAPGVVLRVIAFDRWRELAGLSAYEINMFDLERRSFIGFSPEKGVPHWFIEEAS